MWFIDLTATSAGEVVPSLVAAPLAVGDVDISSARELTDVLADYMADKKLLLILDNCEHVLEAVRALVPSILTTTSAWSGCCASSESSLRGG